MMSKSGIARASSCFLAVGLWLASSDGFRPAATNVAPSQEASAAESVPDFAPAVGDAESKAAKPLEVIDLTVKNLELEQGAQRTLSMTTSLTDGFRPGSVDPGTVAATETARSQQWALAEVFVENSEVTESGSVEYTIRASLRGDSARATASEVIAAARAVSPEVSVIAESLHFVTKPGDELDSLSTDAIRIRVKGGLTFEPSMLRWTFSTLPLRSSVENATRPEEIVTATGLDLGPLQEPEPRQ